MGIYGLLPSIKSIQKSKHVRDFKGLTVAIDSYCWLHKGSYGIAHELMKYKSLELLVAYWVKKIEMLIKYDITPIFVFDGANLPMKDKTEENRDKNRAAKIALAEEYLADGRIDEANRKFSEAIDITPLHAFALIIALKKLKLDYYVAPYEADAQLAYLARNGIVDVVFTEDSDLLAFGAQRVFMKMDKNGFGVEINLADLKKVEELNMQAFDQNMFLSVWIMSGCDYLPSVKGIGFKKAFKYLTQAAGDIKSAVNTMRLKGLTVPKDYLENFDKAFLTFNYQVVYWPLDNKLKHLNDPEDSINSETLKEQDDLSFLGEFLDENLVEKVVNGEIDPISHEELKLDQASEMRIECAAKIDK